MSKRKYDYVDAITAASGGPPDFNETRKRQVLRKLVREAVKMTWDEGNDGPAPDSIAKELVP